MQVMHTFGLVLGAGGDKASAFHAGVLTTIVAETGWDPRTAEVLVGTSAGATASAQLRAGFSADDLAARTMGEPLSPAGQAIADRVVTPYQGGSTAEPSKLPGKPLLVARSVLGGFKPGLAFAGAMPRGTVSGASLEARINEMFDDPAWPKAATWLVTVRLSDGKRMVLGRDDVQVATIGRGVRASTAVPGTFEPVSIDGREYVDGAVHSTTNADLLIGLGLDGVVVSSPKSIAPSAANWKEYPTRTFFRRTLQSEVDKVQKSGAPVLVIEPDVAAIDLMESDTLDMAAVASAASELTRAALNRSKKVAKRLAEEASAADIDITDSGTDALSDDA